MTKEAVSESRFDSVGGSSTHVVLEFPGIGYLYMGSVVTISYSVYREKTPVFNLGNTNVDGFAIGKKYVAGSMVSSMFLKDELADFIERHSDIEALKNSDYSDFLKKELSGGGNLKEVHNYMRDDLTSFNVHLIFTSEYSSEARRIIIYGANFINNGQVSSINDIVTESTASFVAKDVKEQHDISSEISSKIFKSPIITASQLL